MKILVTGAHLTPAVATIEKLKQYQDVKIVYVGRKTIQEGGSSTSLESQVLPKLGVKYIPIITGRLQREFTIYTIPSLLKIPIGLLQSLYIILKEKPNVILSFGGYVAVPLVFVAWLFSIPIIIHEQALVLGLANKISALFADKIALSFRKDYPLKKEKVVITGNPIGKELLEIHKNFLKNRSLGKLPTILITGASQGSHVINLAVEEGLEKLTKIVNIIHQTGESKFKDFERLKIKENANYQIVKWVDNMGQTLKNVDFLVCRAGINTLSELALLGVPALVIPIANHEQQTNAKYFEELGLVRVLPQSKLSPKTLFEEIKFMIKNLDSLKKKGQRAKEIIIKDAANRLALETVLLGKGYE